jgi:phosphoribosylaminoimidazole (AIR) synthetase
VGLIIAVDGADSPEIVKTLQGLGEDAKIVGYCENGEKGVELTW